jgi:hypothetical protein
MGITRIETNRQESEGKKQNTFIMKVFMNFSNARFFGLKGIDKAIII